MVVIGLTGNLGTGKTEVAQMLAELGAIVINADELGHELLQYHTQAYTKILATFGKSILKHNREIDSKKLSRLETAPGPGLGYHSPQSHDNGKAEEVKRV